MIKFSQFLCGEYISKKNCNDLIKYFENNKNKQQGKILSYGDIKTVDKNVKDSTDVFISDDKSKIVKTYLKHLNKVIENYKKEYEFCDKLQHKWTIIEPINIQKYPKNGGFKKLHYEKSGTEGTIKRHLVFMTYLNDVEKGGETEWLYQKIKVKPKKGLTVVWPAEWCFTHRGIPAKNEIKYIITGWYSYV